MITEPRNSSDATFRYLSATHRLLEEHQIWHCITYGTLLGAVRQQDVIPWDHDFDMFIRPLDIDRVLALRDEASTMGIGLETLSKPGGALAMGSRQVSTFSPARIVVTAAGEPVGDLFAPSLFSDGVLRMYDFHNEVIWTPSTSLPHYFVLELGKALIRDLALPTVRSPEVVLEGLYGSDWRTPKRAFVDGGGPQSGGTTTHGDQYEPRLAEQIAWCLSCGWDRSIYSCLPRWPRPVRGGGPIGPSPRTAATSRALWWIDLEEVGENF